MTFHDQAAFLKELAALSFKHKIIIEGCGCCGSPRLENRPADMKEGVYESFDNDGQNVTWRGE